MAAKQDPGCGVWPGFPTETGKTGASPRDSVFACPFGAGSASVVPPVFGVQLRTVGLAGFSGTGVLGGCAHTGCTVEPSCTSFCSVCTVRTSTFCVNGVVACRMGILEVVFFKKGRKMLFRSENGLE